MLMPYMAVRIYVVKKRFECMWKKI